MTRIPVGRGAVRDGDRGRPAVEHSGDIGLPPADMNRQSGMRTMITTVDRLRSEKEFRKDAEREARELRPLNKILRARLDCMCADAAAMQDNIKKSDETKAKLEQLEQDNILLRRQLAASYRGKVHLIPRGYARRVTGGHKVP